MEVDARAGRAPAAAKWPSSFWLNFVQNARPWPPSETLTLRLAVPLRTISSRLAWLGVKRVSLGGALAGSALSTLERAAGDLHDSGTLGFLDGQIGYADVRRRFG